MKITMKEIEKIFSKLLQKESSFEETRQWASRILQLDEVGQLEIDPNDDISKVYDAIIFLSGIKKNEGQTEYIKDAIDQFNKLFGETYFISGDSRVCKIGKLKLRMSELEDVFARVIRTEISFEEASDWASARIEKDKYNELELMTGEDVSEVFDALTYLAGIDLQVSPGEYLHDIKNVIDEYQKLFGKEYKGH